MIVYSPSFFGLKRGFRQEDPLCPFIFIICSKFMSRLLFHKVARGRLNWIKVIQKALAISWLIYADDIVISCLANKINAQVMLRCLVQYRSWSEQEVIKDKSNILFSPSAKVQDRMEVRCSSLIDMGTSAIYLGNFMVLDRRKIKEFGS